MQMTELNAVLRETLKLQDTFNSTVQEPCVETLVEEHFPPLTNDMLWDAHWTPAPHYARGDISGNG